MKLGLHVFVTSVIVLASISSFVSGDDKKDNDWMVEKTLPSLLRFNMKGEVISSDWADYATWNCHGEGSDRTCSLDTSWTDGFPGTFQTGASTSNEVPAYLFSIMAYFGINLVGAILLVLGTFLYLFGLIFYAIGRSCDCCKVTKDTKSRIKPQDRLILTTVVLSCFCVFLFTILVLCVVKGVNHAYDGIGEGSDAPMGVAQIVYNTANAAPPATVGILSTVLLPTLIALNQTLCEALSWKGIEDDIVQIAGLIAELPRVVEVQEAIRGIEAGTVVVATLINATLDATDDIIKEKDEVLKWVNVLSYDLGNVTVALDNLEDSISEGQTAVASMQGYFTTFFGADGPEYYTLSDTDGLVDSIQHDVTVARRNDSVGYGFPGEWRFGNATLSDDGSTSRLISGAYNAANLAELTEMNNRLHGLYVAIVAMPNYTVTAQNVVKLNDTFKEMLSTPFGIFENVTNFYIHLNNSLNAMPDFADISEDVDRLFNATEALNLDPVKGPVSAMRPPLDGIIAAIQKLINGVVALKVTLLNMLDPVHDLLVTQTRNINATIYDFPYDMEEKFKTANDSIYKARDQIQLGSANETMQTLKSSINITYYLTLIDSAQNNIDTQIEKVNQTAIQIALKNADVTPSFDIESALETLNDARKNVESALLDESIVTGLEDLQNLKQLLERRLKTASAKSGDVGSDGVSATADGEYWRLSKGYCSADTKQYCAQDSDCSSGTCLHIGAYRCDTDGTSTAQAFVACTDDTSCTGSVCLADTTRASELHYTLLAFTNGSFLHFDNTASIASFNDFRTQAAAMDLDSTATDLSDSKTTITDSLASMDDYSDSMTEIRQTITDSSSSIDDIRDSLVEGRSSINSVDFGEIVDSLDEAAKFQKMADKNIARAVHAVHDVKDFIYNPTKLASIFDRLTEDHLNGVLSNKGFGGIILDVAISVEQGYDMMLPVMNNATLDRKPLHIVDDVKKDYAPFADRATGNKNNGYVDMYAAGALYYLMQLSNETQKHSVDYRDPHQGTIAKDADGEAYPGDSVYCVTRYCFEQQQEENKNGVVVAGVPLSGTQIMGLIVVPLAIVFLIAFFTLFCPLLPCCNARHFDEKDKIVVNEDGEENVTTLQGETQPHSATDGEDAEAGSPREGGETDEAESPKKKKAGKKGGCCSCTVAWKKCGGSILIFCIILILPIYFFVFGFAFTFTLGWTDSCASGTNVAMSYVHAMGDGLCQSLGGEDGGTLEACYFKSGDINVPVNLNKMFSVLTNTETCSGGNSNDPFYQSLSTFSTQLKTVAESSARKEVAKKAYKKIRPRVKDIIVNAAINGAKVSADFITTIGDDAISCENVYSVLGDVKDPVCNTSAGAVAWYVSMIYLACWTLCCLGIPAGCLVEHHYGWLDIEQQIKELYGPEDDSVHTKDPAPTQDGENSPHDENDDAEQGPNLGTEGDGYQLVVAAGEVEMSSKGAARASQAYRPASGTDKPVAGGGYQQVSSTIVVSEGPESPPHYIEDDYADEE